MKKVKKADLKKKLDAIAKEQRTCLNTIESDRVKCHKRTSSGAAALAAGLSMASIVFLF